MNPTQHQALAEAEKLFRQYHKYWQGRIPKDCFDSFLKNPEKLAEHRIRFYSWTFKHAEQVVAKIRHLRSLINAK